MKKKNVKKIIGYILLIIVFVLIAPLCVWGICEGISIDFHWRYCLPVYAIYILSQAYPIKVNFKNDD